jgi:hypothetical protein
MVHKSLESLQLDRRLLKRRGWIPPEDLDQRLSQLPDVADKIDRSEDEGSGREQGTGRSEGSGTAVG